MAENSGNESVLAGLASTVAPTDLVAGVAPELGDDRRRFVTLQLIGRGGLGEVSEAFDADLRRRVAIKVPRAGSEIATRLIVREAQVTAQLEHPNVPSVHALGIDDHGRPFFAMTRVRGRSLAAILRDDDLPVQRKLRIFAQIAYAVAAAHERGVLHRDLKPDNVMVGELGEVRVMDWGLARVTKQGAGADEILLSEELGEMTSAGQVLGTPGYAAPEQVDGASELDARADVFALGAILYEMLWGAPLVPGDDADARLRATRAGTTVPIEPTAGVGSSLVAIVRKATAHDREARYADVEALLGDIEAFMDGDPIAAVARSPMSHISWLYRLRAHRIHRFRPIDVDLMVIGHVLVGLGGGLLLAHAVSLPLLWAALVVVVGLAAISVPAHTMLRRPKHEEDHRSTTAREGARRVDRRDSGSRSREG